MGAPAIDAILDRRTRKDLAVVGRPDESS